MRQGKGKWVDEHSTVYEGKYFNILVQASLNQILNMDMANKLMHQGRNMRDNFAKGPGQMGSCMTRITILYK